MENVKRKFFSDGTSNGIGLFRSWGMNNFVRSASVPKYQTNIPQYLCPVNNYTPNTNGMSFYANNTTLPPLNKYGMSPEMMKMNMLEAKIHNLERSNNEDIINKLQSNKYMGVSNNILPYLQPNQQKEDRRYEIRAQINAAKNKLRGSQNNYKSYDENDEDSYESPRPMKGHKNRNEIRKYAQSQPTYDEEDYNIEPIANAFQEETRSVRKNLDLMKNMLFDMHTIITSKFEEIDNNQKIEMAGFRKVLESTGDKKIQAGLKKMMDGGNIDFNNIDGVDNVDLNGIINEKIQIHDNEQKKLKVSKKKQKLQLLQQQRLDEQDKIWKDEDMQRELEDREINHQKEIEMREKLRSQQEGTSKKKTNFITNLEVQNITKNDPSRKGRRKKKSSTVNGENEDKEVSPSPKKRKKSLKKKKSNIDGNERDNNPNLPVKKKKKSASQHHPIEYAPEDIEESPQRRPKSKKAKKKKTKVDGEEPAQNEENNPNDQSLSPNKKSKNKKTKKQVVDQSEEPTPKSKTIKKKTKKEPASENNEGNEMGIGPDGNFHLDN